MAQHQILGLINTASSVEYTETMLQSVFASLPFDALCSIIVIDNDRSLPLKFKERFPKVEVLTNSTPRGFAANSNVFIERALSEGSDVILANNDIVLFEGWYHSIIAPHDCIFGPLTNRELQYKASVIVGSNDNVIGTFATMMPLSLSEYRNNKAAVAFIAEMHRRASHGLWQVFNMPFCCCRIPFQILKAVGKLDESFGLGGGEDYDYCLRTYLAGFSVKYDLGGYILHFGGKSSWSGAETREVQLAREAKFYARFLEKWGEPLRDLLLREQASVVDSSPELRVLDAEHNLRAIVEKLAKSPLPSVHL